jgi:hypothetical protein
MEGITEQSEPMLRFGRMDYSSQPCMEKLRSFTVVPKRSEVHLGAMEYVSKWIEALPCIAADSKNSKKMLQETIFPCFEVPRVVISDGGSHLIDKIFRKCISELGVAK